MILRMRVECICGAYLKEKCIRVIEIDEDDSLYSLHGIIQLSVGFGSDHIWDFFAGRHFRNRKIVFTESEKWEQRERDYYRILLADIYPLPKNLKLYYYFDYGDNWTFEIKKHKKLEPVQAGIDYPWIIERIGLNPEQYPSNA